MFSTTTFLHTHLSQLHTNSMMAVEKWRRKLSHIKYLIPKYNIPVLLLHFYTRWRVSIRLYDNSVRLTFFGASIFISPYCGGKLSWIFTTGQAKLVFFSFVIWNNFVSIMAKKSMNLYVNWEDVKTYGLVYTVWFSVFNSVCTDAIGVVDQVRNIVQKQLIMYFNHTHAQLLCKRWRLNQD